MRQLIKYFFWIGCLALGLQTAGAFSLLGPITGTPDASWQITTIGYNPLGLSAAPPGFIDPLVVGPKNLGQGYRRNTPVMYYAFDPSFQDYFGSNGEYAVQQAFDLVNGVLNGQGNTPLYLYSPTNGILGDTNGAPPITLGATNSLDSYSASLSEFPFNTMAQNYTAYGLGLYDLKSVTLSLLMEQLGLADSVRYIWALRNRYTGLEGERCDAPGPGYNIEYDVIQRNFAIGPSALTNVQYSAYVNNELYSYWIDENCGAQGASPPDVDALEVPVDLLNSAPPVASGGGEFPLGLGNFYTGLTRDDVGGLRWLYSTNNYDTISPGGYLESPAAGSTLLNYSAPIQQLSTSNYNALVAISSTNDPTAIQALFPSIQFNYVTNYFSNVVSEVQNYVTNSPIGGVSGQSYIGLQTTYTTNLVDFFRYMFGNVEVNSNYPATTYRLQTITYGSPVGWPVGTPFVTNVTLSAPFQSNQVSGDYFVISNGACPPQFLQTLQTNVNIVTNTLSGVTNADGSFVIQNLISYFTNYTFAVKYCTLTTNAATDYQGVGRMQFIRVSDTSDPYDYLSGTFRYPITNQYDMVVFTNGQYVTQTFQRIVTTPDFLISGFEQLNGPDALPTETAYSRGVNFNTANMMPGFSGPGTIDPPTTISYNEVGPVYGAASPANVIGPGTGGPEFFLWGSFDGTTNAPVVYPNGTSLVNLAASAVVQISTTPSSPSPNTLPGGTANAPYSVAFGATGTVGSVTWTLAPISAGLPSGLNLSAGGVISGTPTQSGTFDNIVVQMSDSSTPPHVVQTAYSLTIN